MKPATLKYIKSAEPVRQLLDEKQAALIIGTATPTLRKSRCTGKLFGLPTPTYLKLGRTIRYKVSVLNDWLESLDQYAVESSKEHL
jgi:hypothetical protein